MEATGRTGSAAARPDDGERGDGWALALLGHAADTVSVLDADGRVVYVNTAVEHLLGMPPAALLGRTGHDLVHPEDLATLRDRFAARLTGADLADPFVYRLRHADGSWRWVESVSANRLADPAVRGVVLSTRDATERVRTEAALRESERRAREHLAAADRAARELALLDRVRTALARQLDLPTLFRSVVEAVAETFGYSQVSLYLREGDASVLQHQVGYGRVLARIPVDRGVSGRVVRSGQPVLLEDVRDDPAFLGAIDGIRSEVCVPLRDDDRVVGFLNLESTGGDRLGPGDLHLMEALAEHVGIAIGRTRVYQQARLSEERFRTAFASSALGTALVGLDGRWLAVNPALCETVGYSEEELLRRTFQAITHPDDHAEDARLIGLLLAGEIPAIRFEKRYIHKRGHPVWVFITGSLVRGDDGTPLSFLSHVQDVSERKRGEAELRAAKEAAEESNRLKSVFLSTMSHELRTPMNAIIGYAHLLLDGLDGELTTAQRQDVRLIAEGADRLLGLIDDVLDLSRIEAGRLDLAPELVDIAGAVAEAVAQVAPLASPKGLALAVDLPAGLPTVRADPLRVRQILLNLLGNAVKFTASGSVRVTGRAVAGGVEVTVTDTGIGIAPAALPHVFDEFRQADSGTTRRYGGSGLGLAISRRLTELHGGTIAVDSTPGVGSTFTLRLPVAPVDAG
ncbi:MAG: PAS domain S-box protein [Chloroflexia bacterium]|nr:PAS domain S-box protein [Chloroflexia bacterium]